MKNTKRKHLKLCLLLLFMVLGCFAITNVRTTTVQASSRTFKSNGRTYMEKHNDNTLNTVLYQKVSGRYKQVAKSSRYLIYRFSYGKKLYFSSADDEGTGITCTYTKGKNAKACNMSTMQVIRRNANGSGKKVIKTVKAKKNYAIAYMWVDSPHKVRYYTYRKSGFDAWKLKTLRF